MGAKTLDDRLTVELVSDLELRVGVDGGGERELTPMTNLTLLIASSLLRSE